MEHRVPGNVKINWTIFHPSRVRVRVCVAVKGALAADGYRTAGECASDSGGTPRVSLFCPPAHMIRVRRSFHGARVNTGTDRCDTGNCTYCPGTTGFSSSTLTSAL